MRKGRFSEEQREGDRDPVAAVAKRHERADDLCLPQAFRRASGERRQAPAAARGGECAGEEARDPTHVAPGAAHASDPRHRRPARSARRRKRRRPRLLVWNIKSPNPRTNATATIRCWPAQLPALP
jgi:hypothetical protein